jgi:hypothetical protein
MNQRGVEGDSPLVRAVANRDHNGRLSIWSCSLGKPASSSSFLDGLRNGYRQLRICR